jgi:hypothetical protein
MIIHPGITFPNSTRRSTPHNVQKAYIIIYWIAYRETKELVQTWVHLKAMKSRWSQMMDPWKRGLGFPCLSEESERWSLGPWAPARFLSSRDERIIARTLMLKCILIGWFTVFGVFFVYLSKLTHPNRSSSPGSTFQWDSLCALSILISLCSCLRHFRLCKICLCMKLRCYLLVIS